MVAEPVAITVAGRGLPPVMLEEARPLSFARADNGNFEFDLRPYDPPLLPALGLREFLGRHLYVYGTTDSLYQTMINREAAERAAAPNP